MHPILLFAFLQALSVSATAVPVRSGCFADDPQIDTVSLADHIQVVMARAGEGPLTCYKIAFERPSGTLAGYVLGDSLPAVTAFVRQRERESQEAAEAQARMALAPPRDVNAPTKALDPNAPSHFDDFSWRDWSGKAGSLSGLGGRATVVVFWPTKSKNSRSELNSVMPLYNEFHAKGLAAVGIGMDPNPRKMDDVLDDTSYAWPQVPDRDGLAVRYHVNPSTGETFVLDSSHRVVAAGPMGPEIEKAVRQLLTRPGDRDSAAPAPAAVLR